MNIIVKNNNLSEKEINMVTNVEKTFSQIFDYIDTADNELVDLIEELSKYPTIFSEGLSQLFEELSCQIAEARDTCERIVSMIGFDTTRPDYYEANGR